MQGQPEELVDHRDFGGSTAGNQLEGLGRLQHCISPRSNTDVINTHIGNKGCKDPAGNNPCCPYPSRIRSAGEATARGRWGGRGWRQVWVPRQGVGGSRRHCKSRKTMILLASPHTKDMLLTLWAAT